MNQSETSHQGPTATSATVEMVTVRVGKRSDVQRQKGELIIWSVRMIRAGFEPCSRRMQFKTIEMGQQFQYCGM